LNENSEKNENKKFKEAKEKGKNQESKEEKIRDKNNNDEINKKEITEENIDEQDGITENKKRTEKDLSVAKYLSEFGQKMKPIATILKKGAIFTKEKAKQGYLLVSQKIEEKIKEKKKIKSRQNSTKNNNLDQKGIKIEKIDSIKVKNENLEKAELDFQDFSLFEEEEDKQPQLIENKSHEFKIALNEDKNKEINNEKNDRKQMILQDSASNNKKNFVQQNSIKRAASILKNHDLHERMTTNRKNNRKNISSESAKNNTLFAKDIGNKNFAEKILDNNIANAASSYSYKSRSEKSALDFIKQQIIMADKTKNVNIQSTNFQTQESMDKISFSKEKLKKEIIFELEVDKNFWLKQLFELYIYILPFKNINTSKKSQIKNYDKKMHIHVYLLIQRSLINLKQNIERITQLSKNTNSESLKLLKQLSTIFSNKNLFEI